MRSTPFSNPRALFFSLLCLTASEPSSGATSRLACQLPLRLLSNEYLAHAIQNLKIEPGREVVLATDKRIYQPLFSRIEAVLREAGRNAGIGDKEMDDFIRVKFRLVFDELWVNAIRHGNKYDPTREVRIKVDARDGRFTLEIADSSGEYHNLLDPNHPVNLNGLRAQDAADLFDTDGLIARRKQAGVDPSRPDGAGGRGVFLMQSYSDGLSYVEEKREGKTVGTRVVVSFDLKKLKKP